MKKFLIAILLSFALVQAFAAKAPNIIFIMLDDCGYGDLGCYNPDSKIPTPHIDSLADQGMRFTDAHTTGSTCVPSRFGLLTGGYPLSSRGYEQSVNGQRRNGLITPDMPTIASVLRDNGYQTAMVGKWHNRFVNWDNKDPDVPDRLLGGPYGIGFDYWFGIPHSLDIEPYLYIRNDKPLAKPTERVTANDSIDEGWTRIQGKFWREGNMSPGFKHDEVLEKFTQESIKFLEGSKTSKPGTRNPEKPFFLYIAMAGPHTPWLPSEEFAGKSGIGLYGDFLMEIDDCIGRILKALEQSGESANTLVCLTSDNGPVWYPQDVEKYDHTSVGPLRGMKGDLFEAGHRVPFIAKWPGKIQAGSNCDELVGLVDMMGTFASVAQIELGETGPDSLNILPLMLGSKKPVRETVLHPRKSLNGYRKGRYKYLNTNKSGGFTNLVPEPGAPPGQLYDLEDDLGETNNLYRSMPEKVKELKAELEAMLESEN
ncbi:MAG: arylsulfatase [Puniceicoccaceae bacterium]